MSENTIEKFTGKLEKEDSGFTMILNDTIQNICDSTALGVYCYLASKPSNWSVNVKEIGRHFGFGRDKTYKCMNYLIEIGALSVKTERTNGKFVETIYFLHTRLKQTGLSPCPENTEVAPLPEKPYPVNQHAYKTKSITKKRKRTPIVPQGGRKDSFFKIWNTFAEKQYLPRVEIEKTKEIKAIESCIDDLISYWPELNKKEEYNLASRIEFTEESFKVYLEQLVKYKWHMVCGDYPHTMRIILKRSNFEKGVLFIKKQLQRNNNQ